MICPPRFAVTLEDVVALRLKLLVEDGQLVGDFSLCLSVVEACRTSVVTEILQGDIMETSRLLELFLVFAESLYHRILSIGDIVDGGTVCLECVAKLFLSLSTKLVLLSGVLLQQLVELLGGHVIYCGSLCLHVLVL